MQGQEGDAARQGQRGPAPQGGGAQLARANLLTAVDTGAGRGGPWEIRLPRLRRGRAVASVEVLQLRPDYERPGSALLLFLHGFFFPSSSLE